MGRLHRRFIRVYDETVVHRLTDYQFVLTNKMSSYDIDGDYIDIDADYTYSKMVEFQAQVSSWAGFGTEFKILYTRLSAALSNLAAGYLQGVSFISRAEAEVDLYGIRSGIFEVSVRAENQEITWLRGLEIAIDSPVLGTPGLVDETVRLNHVRILEIANALNSDIAPTGENVGLWFEYDTASGACTSNWHDIRLAAGPRIFAGAAASPTGAAEPWVSAPLGSIYLTIAPVDVDHMAFIKYAEAGADADWGFLTATTL